MQIIHSEIPFGGYPLYFTEISMGTPELTDKYAGTDLDCQFNVIEQQSLFGDVNLDGRVDVDDVNIVIRIILGKDQAENYDRRAYITDDDTIDVDDVNALIRLILGK